MIDHDVLLMITGGIIALVSSVATMLVQNVIYRRRERKKTEATDADQVEVAIIGAGNTVSAESIRHLAALRSVIPVHPGTPPEELEKAQKMRNVASGKKQ